MANKDLIIGGASNYNWDALKYWINSIKLSGFNGDIVLVATNITKETIEKLVSKGIILELYGKIQDNGDVTSNSNGKIPASVERFFYIWNFLRNNGSKYRYVVSTDTRDVIFQADPSVWLEKNLIESGKGLVAPFEGLRYQDEPWNNNNLYQGYGPYVHDFYKSMDIYNVGVLAGTPTDMRDIFFMIFQMSMNCSIPGIDQAAFNIVINQEPYKQTTLLTSHKDAWVAQLGTTIEAINSGSGDLGYMIKNNPSMMVHYSLNYRDNQPLITEDGFMTNDRGEKFIIVHQYDRTHAWKDKIVKRYE